MLTVDIDTGGTMTDALVSDGATRHSIKVDTTPHDYTIAFQACLSEAARVYGDASIESFLRRVSLIRWSSTITTNVIAERRGAKVGLLVSAGQEENLYGPERSMVVDELVAAGSIVGLSEDADAAEVLAAVKKLLESGVRRICVCLAGSFPDNAAEKQIKDIIEDQYPDHIIGAVPVLLGSEMAQIGHDQTRAHYSTMNAYSHTHLANSLYKAEDILRDAHRWNGALLVGHTNGGVSRIGKTKAVDTIESGPVFGTFGGAYLAKTYGFDKVACFDVGGTTTKSSVVRGGDPLFQRGGELMEVPVKTSFAMLRSAAIGGGSVARVVDGRITLGPDSMGAAPGPASYGLGGDQATVTDALLVLGYLDADRFMGGRRALDVAKAQAALDRKIATPLGVSVAQAAGMIRDEAAAIMAELVGGTLREAGIDPREAALFAYGGNGPMFAAFVAERLNMTHVYAFDFGPVFSAFGSAISDVVHVYERGVGAPWTGSGSSALAVAIDLRRQAARDLVAEGFDPAVASYRYELEFGQGDDITGSIRVDFAGTPNAAWIDLMNREAALAKIEGNVSLLLIRLSARFSMGAPPLEKHAAGGQPAPPTERLIQFNAKPAPVPCYTWEGLSVGSRIDGPAMVNGATLTCPIPPGWSLTVDEYGNARLSGG